MSSLRSKAMGKSKKLDGLAMAGLCAAKSRARKKA